MNERIEHITKQVDEYFDDLTIEFSREAWQAKFAELIVQECADINKQELAFNAFERLMSKYNEHFGVDDKSIKVGSRVKVVSGFNVGAKGTVSYIEPTGRMWVMRDGASTDVFYTPDEVVRIEQ